MTPEQKKAEELIEKFKEAINSNVESTYMYSSIEGQEEAAKQCAIICVDEIIWEMEAIEEDQGRDFGSSYLKKVKQHLLNL